MADFLQVQPSPEEKPEISLLYDRLTGALIGLARATEGNDHMLSFSTAAVTAAGLHMLRFHDATADSLSAMIGQITEEKRKLVPSCFICACPCGRTEDYDMRRFYGAEEKIRALKSKLLSRLCSIGADMQDRKDEAVQKFLYLGLYAMGMDDWGEEELLPILQEAEEIAAQLQQPV